MLILCVLLLSCAQHNTSRQPEFNPPVGLMSLSNVIRAVGRGATDAAASHAAENYARSRLKHKIQMSPLDFHGKSYRTIRLDIMYKKIHKLGNGKYEAHVVFKY